MRFEEALSALSGSLGDRRVTPKLPTGRLPVSSENETSPALVERDNTSSWSAFIRYVDARGDVSERRFTCHKILGFGSATHVFGFCHERQAPRTFVVDRIEELVCCETGETFEAAPHFELLRQIGALTVEDKVLTDVARILVFLARCDGEYHPFERAALEDHFSRYCVRFNGTDAMAEAAIRGSGKLAPDGADLLKAIRRIANAPGDGKVARFVLECGADVIDADGRHAPEEVRWAVELSSALKAAA